MLSRLMAWPESSGVFGSWLSAQARNRRAHSWGWVLRRCLPTALTLLHRASACASRKSQPDPEGPRVNAVGGRLDPKCVASAENRSLSGFPGDSASASRKGFRDCLWRPGRLRGRFERCESSAAERSLPQRRLAKAPGCAA
jgi:hypothetical protein